MAPDGLPAARRVSGIPALQRPELVSFGRGLQGFAVRNCRKVRKREAL